MMERTYTDFADGFGLFHRFYTKTFAQKLGFSRTFFSWQLASEAKFSHIFGVVQNVVHFTSSKRLGSSITISLCHNFFGVVSSPARLLMTVFRTFYSTPKCLVVTPPILFPPQWDQIIDSVPHKSKKVRILKHILYRPGPLCWAIIVEKIKQRDKWACMQNLQSSALYKL